MRDILSVRNMSLVRWLCLAVFALIILGYGVFPSLQNTKGDFANYYTASRLLVDGNSLEPAYRDFTWFQKQMDRYGIQNQVGGFIPHPPSTALVFLPLTPVDPITAKNIWTVFNIILVVLNVWLLSRIANLYWPTTAAIFLSTGYGLLNNFLFGQLYLLVLASILLGIYCSKKQRFILAGISFGSLILMKYVGLIFVLYYAWKKQWRLVWSAAATVFVVFAATVVLADFNTVETFIAEVMPRHLRGEIQDPFSVYFQSWNSLFRRLFVFDTTMNPSPALDSFWSFFLLKNLALWSILGATLLALNGSKFLNNEHESLFQLGLLPCALLLISPANTTYYFLLMTITAVFFIKVLLDLHRTRTAFCLAGLFVLINLPHFMKLRGLADGWLTLIVYSRLWLLLIFFVLSLFLFRHYINFSLRQLVVAALLVITLTSVTTWRGVAMQPEAPLDNAHWLRVSHPEFDRHLGVLMKSPDVGKREVVFSYCELMADDYAIYSMDGRRWTLAMRQNFYDPDLASNDSTLLMVTVWNGRSEIWLSRMRGQLPEFLTWGSDPSWHPNGHHFVFARENGIFMADLSDPEGTLLIPTPSSYQAVISPRGHFLAYCVEGAEDFALHLYELTSGKQRALLHSKYRIESPTWSPREDKIAFGWSKAGNRDVWAIDLATGRTMQLTADPAADTAPTWDAANRRIIFTSDRGRGLEFSALYWVPSPEDLTER